MNAKKYRSYFHDMKFDLSSIWVETYCLEFYHGHIRLDVCHCCFHDKVYSVHAYVFCTFMSI